MSAPALKAAIRTEVLLRRAEVSVGTRRAFAERLAHEGVALARRGVGRATPVASVFLSIRGEPATEPMIEAWRPGEALEAGRYGIPVPLASAREVLPDVLFVPLAAYDRRGFRLGYGAGYYDGSLAVLRRQKTVVAVGVAFSIQEVESVPTEPHDQRLDAVITEHGLMTFGSV